MKKLLFCGASGYGNMGDDAYKIIYEKYLSENYELYFDSPFPDIRLIKDMDAVIIGGGGLIYDNSTNHFEYMKMYMEEAIRLEKPIYINSCGIQLANLQKQTIKTEDQLIDFGVKQLAKWKLFLDKAISISVRSDMDRRILSVLSNNANIYYYPDLAYLMEPVKYHLITPDSYVFVPTESGHKLPKFQNVLAEALKENKRNIYFIAFSRDDYGIVDGLANHIDSRGNFIRRLFISPDEACSIIKDAYKVVTNRYHGAVFSRAVGKLEKDIVVADNRYKSSVEVRPDNNDLALGHIQLLNQI